MVIRSGLTLMEWG